MRLLLPLLSFLALTFSLTPPVARPLAAKNPDKQTTLVFPTFLHTMGIRKATKFQLMLYTHNKVKVRSPEGLAVARLTSWDEPGSKKDDDQVTGYGVNSGANVIIYNKSMTSLGFYGLNERGKRRLNGPTGIAANERGDVYVADTGNHRIVRLFNPKRHLDFVDEIGGRGREKGRFESPQGVALDVTGTLYVTDAGNHRVQIFDANNRFQYSFGKGGTREGELWFPTGLAVVSREERWSHYKDDFLVLIDLGGRRLQKFTRQGDFIKAAGVSEFFGKPGFLKYIAIDYYSNIWVTDMRNHCVHKFDRHLNYLTSFGKKGTGDREFMEPRGIAIYKRFGQVFIAERESAQYYWIGTDIKDFRAEFKNGTTTLHFFLTEPSYLTLTVKPAGDKTVVEGFKRLKYFSGPHDLMLDRQWRINETGKSTAQEVSPAASGYQRGVVHLVLKGEPTYSSANYFSKEVETSVSIP